MTRALTLCPSQKLQVYQKDLDLYLLRGRKLKWMIQQEKRKEEVHSVLETVRRVEAGNHRTSEDVKKANYEKLQKYLNSTPQCLPAYFTCPLTHQLFIDPVLLPSGQSYERAALASFFQSHGYVEPLTSTLLDPKLIFPNTTLKKAVSDFLSRNPWAFEYQPTQSLTDLEF